MIEPESTACPCCAGAIHRIGEDVSEALDVVPAIYRVLRTIRPKYACRGCESAVVQAKARPRLLDGGLATTALVIEVERHRRGRHHRTRFSSRSAGRQAASPDDAGVQLQARSSSS